MSMIYYSFVTKKNITTKDKQLELLERRISIDSATNAAIKLKVLKIGLTANNKFYCDFGEKSPFNFFKCYPVISDSDTLVTVSTKDSSTTGSTTEDTTSTVDNKTVLANYVHPTGWGLCEVIESNVEGCVVGSVFRGMVPFGTHVQFEKATYPIAKNDDDDDAENQSSSTVLTITSRPDVFPAYNQFLPISINSVEHPASTANIDASADKELISSIALTSFPGILTGFCLYHHLDTINKYYGSDCTTVVITSASSKVALAFALSCQENKCSKKIIGVTSESNKVFCESTKLYDQVITYTDNILSEYQDVIMIDISGQGNFYKVNEKKIYKLLVVGNSSNTIEKESTFSTFTIIATIKMIASMMMVPSFIVNAITTKQELYLVFTTVSALTKLWGLTVYEKNVIEFTNTFCNTAISQWNFTTCTCVTEEDIQTNFTNIVQGTVVPNECIVFDVNKAVEHRINST